MSIESILTAIPINPVVIVGCLVVGWVLKHWLPTDNKYIPTAMVILGAVLCVILDGVSVTSIIAGALGGAISTGLHQVFTQYIDKGAREEKDLADLKDRTEAGELGENFFDEVKEGESDERNDI